MMSARRLRRVTVLRLDTLILILLGAFLSLHAISSIAQPPIQDAGLDDIVEDVKAVDESVEKLADEAADEATDEAQAARDAWVSPDKMGGIYAEHCAVCHGDQLQGKTIGPSLLSEVFSHGHSVNEVVASIANG